MRLIDADALMLTIENAATNAVHEAYETGTPTFTEALDRLAGLTKGIVGMINEAPTLNPDDYRPHGRWVVDNASGKIACSSCGCIHLGYNGRSMPNYCPNCGAKMDGKENDK